LPVTVELVKQVQNAMDAIDLARSVHESHVALLRAGAPMPAALPLP
jgi:hypothetical protein